MIKTVLRGLLIASFLSTSLIAGPKLNRMKDGWQHLPRWKKCTIILGAVGTLAGIGVGVKEVFFDKPSGVIVIRDGAPDLNGVLVEAPKDPSVMLRGRFESLPKSFLLSHFGRPDSGRLQITSGMSIFGWLKQAGTVRSILELEGTDGDVLATATKDLVSVGMSFEIKDKEGNLIAQISKEVGRSIMNDGTSYAVIDSSKRSMGRITYKKSDSEGVTIVYLSPQGETAAQVSQKGWPNDPNWTFAVDSSVPLDERVLIFFSAFAMDF